MDMDTTTVRFVEEDSNESEEEEEEEEESYALSALNYGVPIAIMMVIIISLCSIVVYTKIRKRRQRAAGIHRSSAPNISGGVAMNVNVYRNYGVYVNQRGNGQMGVPPGPDPFPHIHTEQPPSYDDVLKEERTGGVENVSFQGTSQENIEEEMPPPYTGANESTTVPDPAMSTTTETTREASHVDSSTHGSVTVAATSDVAVRVDDNT